MLHVRVEAVDRRLVLPPRHHVATVSQFGGAILIRILHAVVVRLTLFQGSDNGIAAFLGRDLEDAAVLFFAGKVRLEGIDVRLRR